MLRIGLLFLAVFSVPGAQPLTPHLLAGPRSRPTGTVVHGVEELYGATPATPSPAPAPNAATAAVVAVPSVEALSLDLLAACSGLDRGVAATATDVRRVNQAVRALEAAAPCALEGDALVEALEGRWRLAYSSTFADDRSATKGVVSQGFAGAPGSRVRGGGSNLGPVFQEIRRGGLDNQVELALPAPLPFLPAARVRIALKHSLEASGRDLRIEWTAATVRLVGARGARAAVPAPRALLGDAAAVLEASLPAAVVAAARGPELAAAGEAARAAVGAWAQQLGVRGVLDDLRARERDAGAFTSTARTPDGRVRVARSGLGEMRVFVRA